MTRTILFAMVCHTRHSHDYRFPDRKKFSKLLVDNNMQIPQHESGYNSRSDNVLGRASSTRFFASVEINSS